MIIAVAVSCEAVRELLGMAIGPSEAEPFWTDFLRALTRRGLRGVKLVISDAHQGLKAAAAKVLGSTWQCCKVHFLRNALAHAACQTIVDRTDVQIDGFHRTERALDFGECFVAAHRLVGGHQLLRYAGTDQVQPIERGFGGDPLLEPMEIDTVAPPLTGTF